MKLKLNISPCPNDTFMFDAMLNGRVDTEGLEFDVKFADIEELNMAAVDNANPQPDISKISYAILPLITEGYAVLNSGSALGRGNGPLLVSREDIDLNDGGLTIALPGEHTTANMLMRRLYPHLVRKSYLLFSEIAEKVSNGDFDAGVLIHEGRFTYRDKGLRLAADLGKEWEKNTGAPLPLGAIVVSRTLSSDIQNKVDRVLKRSIQFAMQNPRLSTDFVCSHAQELSEGVIRDHIELFVNDYSIDLGEEGRRAVGLLTGLDCETKSLRSVFVE